MTTSMLLPLLPDIGRRRAAFILESLEDEVRRCGATFGLLIDRAGQIIAADAPGQETDREVLHLLAARLVPIFLARRAQAQEGREQAPGVTAEEVDGLRLLTLPIRDQWLLAMAFPGGTLPPITGQLTGRWRVRLAQLVPDPAISLRASKAGRTITRDGVDLLFRREPDDTPRDDQGGA